MGALETLHLPVTKKQYLDYKNKRKYKIGEEEYYPEPYTAAINNKILDYKFALLGNVGMTEPQDGRKLGLAYEPADMTPIDDEETGLGVWQWMKETLPTLANRVKEEDVDVDNMLGSLKARTNNNEGRDSIGAVVIPNLTVNLLGEWKKTLEIMK